MIFLKHRRIDNNQFEVQRKILANYYFKRVNDTQVLFFSFLDSSDGSLKASTYHGTIDVYVSQLRKVDLKSKKG